MKKSLLAKIVGVILGTSIVASTIVAVTTGKSLNSFNRSNADVNTIVLNSSNSPTLIDGSATRVDEKNVTWEYSDASDYASGHITLNHQGYFGISSSTDWGYTGISGITANFTSSNELWLLNSTDGITWDEVESLTSGIETHLSDNWRYIRFYNWSDNNTTINIDSITFHYSCAGTSATEDVDGAKASNVIATSDNLTYTSEYSEVSPNSIGGEAIRFTKNNNSKTEIVLGFGETYKIGDIQNSKIEFDMKTANINYGKTMQLMLDSATFGSAIDSSKHSSYKCTNIQDDWYHIEVPITAFASTISGYGTKDLPVSNIKNREINGIKINAGTCVIDNLRITASSCELGIFNSSTYTPKVGEAFWLKTSWVGVLHPEQVTMTFSDNTLARKIPLDDPLLTNGSPFYLELLNSGTLTITCKVVCGYNRRVQTIQHTITIQ